MAFETSGSQKLETSLKGFGYPSSVGDAGPDHPDANVVSFIFSLRSPGFADR